MKFFEHIGLSRKQTPFWCLFVVLIGFFLALEQLILPKPQASIAANINGLRMANDDKQLWRQIDVDDESWPLSVGSKNGFNHVQVPSRIGWLRTPAFGLPGAFKEQPMAVHITSGATYELYWNGQFLGRNGSPATDLESETNGIADSRFYLPPSLILPEGNVVAIRYSAHGYNRLPLPLAFSIQVMAFQNEKFQRLASLVPAFLLIGGVAAGAIFFLALFFRNREDRRSLFLALMFFMVVIQLASESSRALVSFTYIGQLMRIGLTLLAAYGSGLFLLSYTSSFTDSKAARRTAFIGSHAFILISLTMFYGELDELTYSVLAIFAGVSTLVSVFGLAKGKSNMLPIVVALIVLCLSFAVGPTLFLDRYYFVAMAILAVTFFIVQATEFRRSQEKVLETSLRLNRLELDLLKRQIQPHFIMNTLTALSEWILTSPEQSVEMIDTLSEEFRLLNGFVGKPLVALSDEILLCQSHLTLMSFRQDREFRLDCTLAQKTALVPPAIFHTIIENALTHNRYSTDESVFTLTQSLSINEEGHTQTQYRLQAPMGDKAHRMSSTSDTGGLGVSYILARLEESWGKRFTFSHGQEDSGWCTHITVTDTDQLRN